MVFDLFGTLAGRFPVPAYHQTLARMANTLMCPRDCFLREWNACYADQERGVFPRASDTIKSVCARLGASPSSNQVAAAERLLPDFIRCICRPRPNVLDTLAEVRLRSIKIGMISNCPPEVPPVWHDSPFAQLVDAAVFSCAVRIRKPDAEIYRLAASALNTPISDCLFVGDGGAHELSGAKRAGMEPVLLSVPGEEDPYHLSPEASAWAGAKVQSLSEVAAKLLRLGCRRS